MRQAMGSRVVTVECPRCTADVRVRVEWDRSVGSGPTILNTVHNDRIYPVRYCDGLKDAVDLITDALDDGGDARYERAGER